MDKYLRYFLPISDAEFAGRIYKRVSIDRYHIKPVHIVESRHYKDQEWVIELSFDIACPTVGELMWYLRDPKDTHSIITDGTKYVRIRSYSPQRHYYTTSSREYPIFFKHELHDKLSMLVE